MYATSRELFIEILHKLFPRIYAATRKYEVPLLSSMRECCREDTLSSIFRHLLDIHLNLKLVDVRHQIFFPNVIRQYKHLELARYLCSSYSRGERSSFPYLLIDARRFISSQLVEFTP